MPKLELTDEQKIKVFSQHIGSICAITDAEPYTQDSIEGIDAAAKQIIAERTSWPLNEIKLVLKPLSEIEDEECNEYLVLLFGEKKGLSFFKPHDARIIFTSLFNNKSEWKRDDLELTTSFLKSKGYDTGMLIKEENKYIPLLQTDIAMKPVDY